MQEILVKFFQNLTLNPIEIYSESAIRHELALFIRINYPELHVNLEYPISRVFNPIPKLTKKEIDIYVTDEKGSRNIIDFVMPKDDAATPNEMYRVIQGVKFLEEIKKLKMDGCTSVLITKRKTFWMESEEKGIYKLFNGNTVDIRSVEVKDLPPFIRNKGPVHIENNYTTQWAELRDNKNELWKYYILNI